MKRLIDKTIKPFLIIAGLCTSVAGLNAFLPRFVVANVLKLSFIENYTIIVQHRGILSSIVG
jgi:hypothetical protein